MDAHKGAIAIALLNGTRKLAARVGTQLSDHQQRFDASHESGEGTVSRLGIACASAQVYTHGGEGNLFP
jgi:hypothetical protein